MQKYSIFFKDSKEYIKRKHCWMGEKEDKLLSVAKIESLIKKQTSSCEKMRYFLVLWHDFIWKMNWFMTLQRITENFFVSSFNPNELHEST